MLFVNEQNKLPIKSWCRHIEPGAMRQVVNLANHPMLFRHVALMPDCHEGYGMPIGGVIACQRAVIPNAVGVDIGCGMCAFSTSLRAADMPRERLKRIMQTIRARIPLGFEHRKQKVADASMPPLDHSDCPMPVVEREYENARSQLGTLGGGNHFIEIQRDRQGAVWMMLHSGSRNIGKQVADHYNHVAENLDRRRRAPLPKDWQLAYLEVDTKEGLAYLEEMTYCVSFALANRDFMMNAIREILVEETAGAVTFGAAINIAHNYAARERHFGRDVWVHRKGATPARAGETGIIPGSQGAKSLIVRGKGNPESFESCSHGAGRRMGRKQAQRELDLRIEIARLDEQGIVHSLRSARDLDEAAGAYKDIDEVMASQADLVDGLVELNPMAVVKG